MRARMARRICAPTNCAQMTSALPPEQGGQHGASTEDEETADGKAEHRRLRPDRIKQQLR